MQLEWLMINQCLFQNKFTLINDSIFTIFIFIYFPFIFVPKNVFRSFYCYYLKKVNVDQSFKKKRLPCFGAVTFLPISILSHFHFHRYLKFCLSPLSYHQTFRIILIFFSMVFQLNLIKIFHILNYLLFMRLYH